ncbi:hypothetical protein [Nocardioides bizhenqiangii]|uniref:Uncharacterized protein n=1 Tax=Nocardioides bizhenqiangii TaxID=3095076 RepID=A0ABZ0ZKI5_9ACTN|nr:hypothetical protein [Nocardioides sp. HM61]WQQ24894.1 hypothetical protein SHK19_13060 [Nocardioides sp. HM61]
MRSFGTATVLIMLLVLTGCGSGGDDADDVPTITTRPSVSATSTPTSATSAPSTDATTETSSTPTLPATSEPTPTETAGPSPEPPTDDPVGPTTYREAQARLNDRSTGEPVTRARFTTPDDVVYCLLDDLVIGPACELRRGFIKDAEVCGGGTADGVGRIETFEDRARPVCNTDTIREPGADEIAGDGVLAVSGDVRCLVETVGVTCLDTGARTGFFLAPLEYHVF